MRGGSEVSRRAGGLSGSAVGRRTGSLALAAPLGVLLLLTAACSGGSPPVPTPDVARTIRVTSPDFGDGRPIPRRFTCEGAGASPGLAWTGVPGRAAAVALVVSDPDAPGGTYLHWVVYDLPPRDGRLDAGADPVGRQAENSAGDAGWTPPCPPDGVHHYVFSVYAVDRPIPRGSTDQVFASIGEHALARGTLTGTVNAP